VTVAAVFVLGPASTALAGTSGGTAWPVAQPADLIPDASWHGRPIKRPDPAPTALREPVASTVIEPGAGFGRPAGSTAVRDVQLRLVALGYRPGLVDGVFGPRTRSSVAWFQIKHRLPPTGVVDGQTLNVLRFRTHAGVPVPQARPPAAPPSLAPAPSAPRAELAASAPRAEPAAAAPRPDPAPAAPGPDADRRESGLSLGLLLTALALSMLTVAALSGWLRGELELPRLAQLREIVPKRVWDPRVPARAPLPSRGHPAPGVAAASPNGHGGAGVIGYAVGRDDRDFARQQRAIERVCGDHGWTLTALVKERDDLVRSTRRRPGLAHVLHQVAAGGARQLIVSRLQSLARSPAELAVLLEWCRQRQVGLVALDVGLDTSTADGRLAARCLGAVAAAHAQRKPPATRSRNGNRSTRTTGVR
jgi:hypothetical protein